MNLNGDPFNLQGGAASLQGSVPALQAGANPQQATSIYGPPPTPSAPVAPVRPVKPKAAAARPLVVQQPVQPKPLNSIFEPFIGNRPSPLNPGVLEYYRKDTNQALTPQELFSFASQLGGGQVNGFDQLHAPVTKGLATQVYEAAPVKDPNRTLAETAGSANLNPDDVLKLLQQSNALTSDQLTQIQAQLGIPEAYKAAFEPPKQNTVDFYNQAYNTAGLVDVKKQILALNEKVNASREQFTDAQAQINENPFLSEASRVGRIKRLQERAEQQIGNLLDQQKQYQDLYQQGLGEVNNLVTRHASDFQTNQELNAAKLTYLTSRAEQQAAATIAEKNQAAFKYLPDYLKAKAKATAPNTLNAGNGATFYYDKASGTFVQLTQAPGQFDLATNPITGEQTPFNKQTGQLSGVSGNFSGYAEGTARRLVANNNPTAFTTDVTKTMGLVEGVDYVQGDKFPGSSNLYTAKLLGDPIAVTIKGIDKAGFFTASGQPRWSYVNELPQDAVKNWKNLSYEEKAAVIQQMFIREGGKGTLSSANSSDPVTYYGQQVQQNPQTFNELSAEAKKAAQEYFRRNNIPFPNTVALTQGQKDKQASLSVLKSTIAALEQLGNQTNWKGVGGSFQGSIAQFLAKNFGVGSQQEQMLRSYIGQVQGTIAKERGGTSFTPNEQALLESYTPTINDNPLVIQSKVQVLKQFLQNSSAAYGPSSQTPPSGATSGTPTVNLSDLNFVF